VARAPDAAAVVLVGFMGAGKSAVGRELATLLRVPFRDTDEAIAAAEGRIPEIFAVRGKAGFRALEAAVVVRELAALRTEPKVLALGGGAVLDVGVRGALRHVEHVVWLTAPAGELWRRVGVDEDQERPLARDEQAFTALLAAREALYGEVATLVVDTSGRDAARIAAELVAALNEPGAAGSPARSTSASGEGAA
jgi:shikimate kinase